MIKKERSMQNDFEKQVKQRLDELKLVPSEPVWTSIEGQIREKKDRRRLLFWLPLLVLLSGGGVWWAWHQKEGDHSMIAPSQRANSLTVRSQERSASSTTPVNQPNTTAIPVGAGEQNRATAKARAAVPSTEQITKRPSRVQLNNEPVRTDLAKRSNAAPTETYEKKAEHRPASYRQEHSKEKAALVVNPISQDDKQQGLIRFQESRKDQELSPSFSRKPMNFIDPLYRQNVLPSILPLPGEERKIVTPSIHQEVEVTIRRRPRSSWGITAGVGLSAIRSGKGLSFINQDDASKSLNAVGLPASNGGGPAISYQPSGQRDHISFAAGLAFTRQLSARWKGSTGLEFRYFSTVMKIGNRRPQDTALNSIFAATYSMAPSGYSSYGGQDYQNHFSYLALPVAFSYQPLKKWPVQVSAGLSVQYLLHTNALEFNNSSGIYYLDTRAFRKLQWMAQVGLNGQWLRIGRYALDLGPDFSLGSALEKNGYPVRHLYAFGFHTRLMKKGK
jgi:Outer membrane protein beta-barrel domain